MSAVVQMWLAVGGFALAVLTTVSGGVWVLSRVIGALASRLDVQVATLKHMDLSMTAVKQAVEREAETRAAKDAQLQEALAKHGEQLARTSALLQQGADRQDKHSDRIRALEAES